MLGPVAPTLLLAVTEPAGEESTRELLVPATNELVWGTVAFLAFLFFMVKYVMPIARKTLAERTAGIEGKLAQAEADRNEAQALLARYQQQLAEAREEAGRIRTEAQSQRAEIVEEARAEARTEAQRITESATAQIASERLQALTELRREVGTLAVDLAGRIVGESLEDDARQRRSVERYLAELEGPQTQSGPQGQPAGTAV